MSPPRDGPRERVLRGIAVIVTAVWVATVAVQVIDPSRQVPQSVNIIMGMIVSGLLGVAAVNRSRNGRD